MTLVGVGGRTSRARGLLDSGSEASFVSEALFQRLGAPYWDVDVEISAIGGHRVESSQRSATLKIITHKGL